MACVLPLLSRVTRNDISAQPSQGTGESHMEVVFGTVRELFSATGDATSAFVVDGGLEVHFAREWSNQVFDFVRVGSELEISGHAYCGMSGDPCINAQSILDINSLQSLDLQAPPQSPVASPSSPFPLETAPLAPLCSKEILAREVDALVARLACATSLSEMVSRSQDDSELNRKAAARSVELAYDGVHRAQALMAYVRIVDLASPDTSQLLDESKFTYEQAVASFQRDDFLVACEFAEASIELARSVELLVARSLRSDVGYPTLVAIPPQSHGSEGLVDEAGDKIARVQGILTRIHWLLRCGTLPAEDREQVRRITSWSDNFFLKGRRFLRSGAVSEAAYYIRAAEAVAHSAEHVCKQDYVIHA
jgi:hypothetical protein